MENSFEMKLLKEWTNPNSLDAYNKSIDELQRLMIITGVDLNSKASVFDSKKSAKYELNPFFRVNFRKALAVQMEPWGNVLSSTVSGSPVVTMSKSEIDAFSSNRWNEVLGFIVDILPPNHSLLEFNIVNVFVQRAGLMREEKGRLVITSAGYEYMLKDYQHQVWDFVLQAVRYAENLDDALALLFMLSYCRFGQGYRLDALTKTQRQLVFEFSQLGVVCMPSPKTASHFFPSRIAIDMIFGAQPSTAADHSDSAHRMTLIVETNNQVVAYVSSELHLALLKLFVDVSIRMPNMAIGRITREKSKQAFRAGINAAQIVDFLTIHAHSTVRNRRPVIPENVTDQLTLWEAESFRIQAQEAIVVDLNDIPGTGVETFEALVENLRAVNVLIWHKKETLVLAVVPEGFQLITSYFKEKLGYYSYV